MGVMPAFESSTKLPVRLMVYPPFVGQPAMCLNATVDLNVHEIPSPSCGAIHSKSGQLEPR